MHCGGPEHRYSFVMFTFSGPLELYGSTCLFGNRVALNPGLGGVSDVASAIISNEHTLSNRVCCFQISDAVYPKDLIFRLFETRFYRSFSRLLLHSTL